MFVGVLKICWIVVCVYWVLVWCMVSGEKFRGVGSGEWCGVLWCMCMDFFGVWNSLWVWCFWVCVMMWCAWCVRCVMFVHVFVVVFCVWFG